MTRYWLAITRRLHIYPTILLVPVPVGVSQAEATVLLVAAAAGWLAHQQHVKKPSPWTWDEALSRPLPNRAKVEVAGLASASAAEAAAARA